MAGSYYSVAKGATALYYNPAAIASMDQKIDIVLVGDSLGMVIQGENNTHNVKMDDILYHVSCVSKNKTNFILMSDMPKNSYEDCKSAYLNAKKLLDNNVDIVKYLSDNKIGFWHKISKKKLFKKRLFKFFAKAV